MPCDLLKGPLRLQIKLGSPACRKITDMWRCAPLKTGVAQCVDFFERLLYTAKKLIRTGRYAGSLTLIGFLSLIRSHHS